MNKQSTLTSGGEGNFEQVHARLLLFFPELVAQLGGDKAAILEKAGIGAHALTDAESDMSYRQAVNLVECAASELGCPDFGMRLAAMQSGGRMFGPLGRVMYNSRTFGDALRYVSQHSYAHSLAARVWLRPLADEGMVFCGHDILLDAIVNRAQAMEQILLLGHLEALHMTSGHARARRVHFRHQQVSPSGGYRRHFGCEVRFGEPADGVAFSEADLACPITDPDSEAFEAVTAYIERHFTHHRPPLHAETRGVIMRRLASGQCTNEGIARELNLHLRTLHRRLTAEGTSFQQVKDEVRRDVMLYYVQQTGLEFAEISERLGFAEQSIMTRRCNSWFAMSPTKLREQARRDRPATSILSESVKP